MSEPFEIPGLVMGQLAYTPGERFTITPARIEAAFPNGFRWAVYPDGSRRLQGAYAWTQGADGGVIWKDLPEVAVDEHGREIG